MIIATTSTAQSQADIEKLFNANPTKAPSEGSNEISNLKIFSGPRHDEFDWALTKVSTIL